MVGKSKAFNNEIAEQCRICLKKLGNNGEQAKRLQAIISAKEYGVIKAAQIFNISRRTLNNWLHAFKNKSIDGLKVQTGRGRKSIFNAENAEKIRRMLEENPGITIDQLHGKITEELRIKMGRTSVYRVMRKLKFAYITPRPQHYKSDKVMQEKFKKKSNRHN